jgi:hypothetical protein
MVHTRQSGAVITATCASKQFMSCITIVGSGAARFNRLIAQAEKFRPKERGGLAGNPASS